MTGNRKGFTLIELMITMLIAVIVLGGAASLFGTVLTLYKQQGKIAEAGMDRLVGLEILRKDIEHAGYGLPWGFQSGIAYNEAASGLLNDAPSSVPRAILASTNTGLNGSDRLIIKSARVGKDETGTHWALLSPGGVTRTWTPDPPFVNLRNTDRVTVLTMGVTDDTRRSLVFSGANWYTTFLNRASFAPTNPGETRVIYGIDNSTNLRMPFNRAEYYIDSALRPERCAPNTGVLVKSVVRQSDGTLDTPLPLLDCVADIQVMFDRDIDNNGAIEDSDDDITLLSADQIRDQLKTVRVVILAHEGQRDPAYTHPTSSMVVAGHPVAVDVRYRWRLYTLTVDPISMRD